MPYYSFDYTYILVLIGLVLTLWAQISVKAAFAKYSNVPTARGLTGADAARMVLHSGGVTDVTIGAVAGELTDHYDPRSNCINLSAAVGGTASCAAVGVAAHEAGHALQYASGYFPVRIRTVIIPLCNFASSAAMPVFLIGAFLSSGLLMYAGIVFFAAAVFFQVVTLPVELNASRRAMNALRSSGMFTEAELEGAKKVLRAAAMTYLASLASSLLQILRLILITDRRGRR